MAFDVYDWTAGKFMDPNKAALPLARAGFSVVPTVHHGRPDSYAHLERMANERTVFAPSKGEGIYVKVSDGEWITHRFKMVREGFQQGSLLEEKIKKNRILK